MRTLLVLLTAVLISGCAASPESIARRQAQCAKYNNIWNETTGRCQLGPNRGPVIAEPIIDKGTATFDASQYASDLSACRQYANQVASQTLDNALGGLLLGAAMGAIIDGSYNTSSATKSGAMTGALAGGVHGSASTHQGRALVLRKCLAGRGYSVLDM